MIVNKRSLYLFRLISDLILLNAAFIIAAIAAQSWDILIERDHMFILQLALNIVWFFFSKVFNFYDDTNSRYFAFQFVNIIKNVFIQALSSIIFIFLVKEDLFTRNFIVIYSLLIVVFVSLRNVAFRKVLKFLRKKGKNIRNLIIIGAGEVGVNFLQLLEQHPDFGYRFIGFLDDKYDASNNEKIIGRVNRLEEVIKHHKVEEVVIALPDHSGKQFDELIEICNRNAVKTHIVPDYFRYLAKKFRVSMIGNFPIITVRNEPLDEAHWKFVKRLFDIVFSLFIILTLLWWMIPILSLLIKLDSKGPGFFVQERIGMKNKKFNCYKLRTMKSVSKGEEDKFIPAAKDDPRITKIGSFLRRSNLDELPQFINVLKGEMSVVGPRPHAIPYDSMYGEIVDEIKLRHSVKPGITGWAQVHGLRGDVKDEAENQKRTRKRIEYDIWYIENWSIWLDIQIILLTVWRMLSGKARGN